MGSPCRTIPGVSPWTLEVLILLHRCGSDVTGKGKYPLGRYRSPRTLATILRCEHHIVTSRSNSFCALILIMI